MSGAIELAFQMTQGHPTGRHLYYDKECNKVTRQEWSLLAEQTRRVLRTETNKYRISTVWIGLDHQIEEEGPVLIYETMTFGECGEEISCERCSTEEEAIKQHMLALERFVLPQPTEASAKKRKIKE